MISLESYVDYCMALGGVTQDFPFDKKTMVFRYKNKIFALLNISWWQEGKASVNLKNKPEVNIQLRKKHASVIPGYHMNKKHWNTINIFEEELLDEQVYGLTQTSYQIIKGNFT